jgi:hypothetical protein
MRCRRLRSAPKLETQGCSRGGVVASGQAKGFNDELRRQRPLAPKLLQLGVLNAGMSPELLCGTRPGGNATRLVL